jgi:hypothetical protein
MNCLKRLVDSYQLATKRPPPAGQILVHNRPDPRSFRAWWATPGGEFILCGCGWRPDLGEHYRVHRPDPAEAERRFRDLTEAGFTAAKLVD